MALRIMILVWNAKQKSRSSLLCLVQPYTASLINILVVHVMSQSLRLGVVDHSFLRPLCRL
jgi:hypothetical protein